ncbi:heavy metal translocating P-type ATPase [Gilvimarinus sp. SDUM040013]|uniref:Heavy metal translocating P-type ATPase n=1 Tax=Gilvimarinus gilvus TaxID=3058038 RepID=A0ABU4RTK5_9GAMM|nr:heavy metal translocating P-type ATPase [Gilvimarinus sp. SDUM040013]MDO3387106.1 heavy metal translocating P-type ATPase [Gilvimarinus sp. SDUM040013]MDX6847999.1 heavy metal translocating P-type ATPase [Gilvimarinus sp. SDUM040013]
MAQTTPATESETCYHCGLPLPRNKLYVVELGGIVRRMCCPGCQAVASAIADGGLSRFYKYRQSSSQKPSDQAGKDTYLIYDDADIQADFVVPFSEGLVQANLILQGITCAACSWLIEKHLLAISGVESVRINVTSFRAQIIFAPSQVSLSQLMQQLAAIGYTPLPATDEAHLTVETRENRLALIRLGVAGFGMMQVGMVAVGLYTGAADQWQVLLRWLSLLLSTPVVFFSAQPFFRAALRSLKAGQLVMDVPVSLAIAIGYSASLWATVTHQGDVYFESIAMFVFLLLVGRYLEMRSRARSRVGRSNVAQLLPAVALRWQVDAWQSVPVRQVQAGDRIRVDAGQNICADGVVRTGRSSVSEAFITGESRPVAKRVGDTVIAGSENIDSPLEVDVVAVGSGTRLSAVVRLIEQAEADKPHRLAIADRVARYFVATVLLVCAGVFATWWWLDASRALWVALSVLVVTCPCALALAMPTALTTATEALRKQGLLITRGHVLESAPTITRVLFDKTGTLTTGNLSVAEINIARRGLQENEVLSIAAALEEGCRHPIARAFGAWANTMRASDVQQTLGAGVEGSVQGTYYRLGRAEFAAPGCSVPAAQGLQICLGDEQGLLASIVLDDPIRDDAAKVVAALQARGIAVELLSGDAEANVARVAANLGIDTYRAGATPEDKLSHLAHCQAQGDTVAMVGDGINDVPVLAKADVSVAMARASELAATHADVLLLADSVLPIEFLLNKAEQTRRVIWQNLSLSVLYNVLALPLAACGLVAPWAAAIGMTTSSLVVVFNALRLARR